MEAIFNADVIEEDDIIKCSDRALMRRYFTRRLRRETLGPDDGIVAFLNNAAAAFLESSEGKYSMDLALETLVTVLIDQILVHQDMQHPNSGNGINRILWWCELEDRHHRDCSDVQRNMQPLRACLHIACVLGDRRLVQQLLTTDGNKCSVLGRPLQTAIRLGSIDIIRIFLDWEDNEWMLAKIRPRDAVHRPDVLKIILDLPIDFESDESIRLPGSRYSYSPRHNFSTRDAFFVACKSNSVPSFLMLYVRGMLEHNSRYSPYEAKRALLFACRGRATDIVRLLFEIDPQLDPNFVERWWTGILKDSGHRDAYLLTTPLQNAARWGDLELVQLLLDHGADPNIGSPVHMAASRGHFRCMKLLIGPAKAKYYPVSKASWPCRPPLDEIIRAADKIPTTLLLEHGFAPEDSEDRNAVIGLALKENIQWIVDLLGRSRDIAGTSRE